MKTRDVIKKGLESSEELIERQFRAVMDFRERNPTDFADAMEGVAEFVKDYMIESGFDDENPKWTYGDILELKNEFYYVRVKFETYRHTDERDFCAVIIESLFGNMRVSPDIVTFANAPGAWRLYKPTEDPVPWWEKKAAEIAKIEKQVNV